MSKKLILILVDGVGADFFSAKRHLLPCMSRLACNGLHVERLAPETCATSLPGRASILTGVPASQHGIYGNIIWGEGRFRYATPYDIRTSAITRLARDHNRRVACVGYGMAKVEDCHLFHAPFWVSDYLAAHTGATSSDDKEMFNSGWLKVLEAEPDFIAAPGFIATPDLMAATKSDVSTGGAYGVPVKSIHSRLLKQAAGGPNYELLGQINDQILMDRIAELALSGQEEPDFLLGEIAMPDYFFHKYGCDSEQGLWAAIAADSMIARLLAQLEQAGVMDQWQIAIMSDHGHMDVDQALFPANILPAGTLFSCESSVLHVAVSSKLQADDVEQRLAKYDVVKLDGLHMPEDLRGQVVAFLASDGVVFEDDTEACGLPLGKSHYASSHGFYFGHKSDERFAVFSGADIGSAVVNKAAAEQIAPTLASMMKLPVHSFPASPLI